MMLEKIDHIPEGYKLYTIKASGKQYVVPESCCLFCKHCSDIFWDYTNGIYMVICDSEFNVEIGMSGQCFGYSKE